MFFHAGRGVFLTADQPKGSSLVQYAGELLKAEHGYLHESLSNDESVFRFLFQFKNSSYW
jgi:hypothetical protein